MTFATQAAYGAAHFGKSVLWNCSGLVFLFYLTEVVGFEPLVAGGLLAVSLLVNGVCDFFIGWALGTRVRSVRAAAVAQVLGAVVASVAFVAFAAVGALAPEDRMLGAVLGLMAFRLGYALLDVPQNAILGFATTSDAERARLTAVRYGAAGLALLAVTLALAPWIATDAPDARASWFLQLAFGMGGLTLGSSLFLAWTMRGHGSQRRAVAGTAPALVGSRASVAFGFVLASILAYSLFVPFFSKLEAYFVAFVLPDGAQRYFMVAVALGQVLAQPLWALAGGRLGLLGLYRLAAWALIAAVLTFLAGAKIGGIALLGAGMLYGGAASGLLVGIWSSLAACASRDPAKTTLRFGQFTFCSKVAQAAGAAAIGGMLQAHSYVGPGAEGLLVTLMAAGPLTAAGLCLAFSVIPRSFWGRGGR